MNLLVTLNSSLGADLGPNFNLTADVGSVGPSTATRSELLVGKSVSVSDTATQLTVTSTGTCTNSLDLLIDVPPSCTCRQGTITNNNAFSYTDCSGVLFSGGAEQGSEVCVNIDLPYSANIGNLTTSVICNCN
jgi:hypothetical protein